MKLSEIALCAFKEIAATALRLSIPPQPTPSSSTHHLPHCCRAMPVHGLWEHLRAADLVRDVRDAGAVRGLLEGRRVAVDLSM